MSNLVLDAEALYRELLRGVGQLRTPETRLVGITSGCAWLAERPAGRGSPGPGRIPLDPADRQPGPDQSSGGFNQRAGCVHDPGRMA